MLSLLRNDDRVFALQPFHIWNLRTCALTNGRIGHTCQTGRTRHDRRAIAISEIRARLLVKVLSMPQAIYDVWYQLANDEHVGEEMELRRLSEQDAQFELGPAPSEEDALMSLVDEELAYSQMFASLEDQSTSTEESFACAERSCWRRRRGRRRRVCSAIRNKRRRGQRQ